MFGSESVRGCPVGRRRSTPRDVPDAITPQLGSQPALAVHLSYEQRQWRRGWDDQWVMLRALPEALPERRVAAATKIWWRG
jgi:hypothetical protein